MKNKKFFVTGCLLVCALGILVFPSLLLADSQSVLNSGSTAYPAPNDPDCYLPPNGSPDNPECTWLYPLCGPVVVPASIGLSWELEGLSDPTCYVSCFDSNYKGCTPSSGISGKKDGLFDYNYLADGGTKLSSSDQVGTRDTKLGYRYRVNCSQANPVLSKKSNELQVVGCASCERTFAQTVDQGLAKSKPTHITEKDLKSWATRDDKDFVNYPLASTNTGSGDARDIENTIIGVQCSIMNRCGYNSSYRKLYFNSYPVYETNTETESDVAWIKKTVNDSGYPVNLTLRQLDWDLMDYGGQLVVSSHAVIVTGVTEGQEGEDKIYGFRIIDPNYPTQVTELKRCRAANLVLKYDRAERPEVSYHGLYCDDSKYGKIGVIWMEEDNARSYAPIKSYEAFCNSIANQASYKDLCVNRKGKINKWLESNLISIENPANGGGCCAGWTTFILRAAFYGDFVGADYHPGKEILGRDCDENYYPTGGGVSLKKESGQSFLANIFQINSLSRMFGWLRFLPIDLK